MTGATMGIMGTGIYHASGESLTSPSWEAMTTILRYAPARAEYYAWAAEVDPYVTIGTWKWTKSFSRLVRMCRMILAEKL